MKKIFIIALLLIGLTVKATETTNLIVTDTTEVIENNVLYKAFSDNNYVYLNVSTSDKKTSISIIRKGLTIYFDIKGKQKKNVYIKYPYNTEPKQLRQNSQNQKKNEDLSIIDLNPIIENLPKEAEYGYFDEKQTFHKDLNSQDIFLGYTATGELFEFSLKIPKNKINNGNKTDFSKLSIGVLTNKFERGSKEGNEQDRNQGMKRGNGNRGGSGMKRGGGMGRGNGQMKGGNNEKRQSPQTEQISIDFWFDAKIVEK